MACRESALDRALRRAGDSQARCKVKQRPHLHLQFEGGAFDHLPILGYSDVSWGAVRLTKGGPMRVMKVAKDRHIVLPKRLFRPDDTVLIVTENDTVVIKKVHPRLSSVAQRVRGRALSLPTIVREVRAHRKHHRQA